MKSLFDDLPKFCPACGQPLAFDIPQRTAFINGYPLSCPHCRHKFQFLARHVAEERLANELHPIFTAP